MSNKKDADKKSKMEFWQALVFLKPHWKIVTASIVCALVVGASFTSGLTTILPIVQVFIKGDTIQAWVDRQIVTKRLGVHLADDPQHIVIASAKPGEPASQAGLNSGEIISVTGMQTPEPDDKPRRREQKRSAAILEALARESSSSLEVQLLKEATPIVVQPKPVPGYLKLASGLANRLPRNPVWSIAAVFGLLAVLACFGNFMRFWQEYLADKASILAVMDVRRKLYDHVLHIPMSFFGQKGTSDVTSRMTQDAGGLLDGFKAVLGRAIQEPINAGLAFFVAMFLSWKLTLFIVVFAPLMVGLISKFGKKMRRANRKALENSSQVLAQLEGTLSGIRVVKAATAERIERRRYRTIIRELVNQHLRLARLDAMSAPILESLTLIVVGIVVVVAAYMVLESESLKAEEFILIMGCLMSMGDSLRKLTKVNNALQKSSAAAGRIFQTLAIPTERPSRSAAASEKLVKLPPMQREVQFDNVTFTYPGAPAPAITNVSLTVTKGQSVAIVGRNGSGKTTLLALLARFYDPDSGRVLIDGTDVSKATLRSLRGQISVVTQDSVIFAGTVAENIAYGHPLTTKLASQKPKDIEITRPLRAAIGEAARRAFAHDFIMEKPRGYDTPLGGQGSQLSGGQKQRLCIARAIFRASPILVLDEATSQVDADSEHLIQQAIESVMHERTTFVIAHRFSTIVSADSIVVMDRGTIVGQGRHSDLLASCPTYRQLYERQLFSGDTPEIGAA